MVAVWPQTAVTMTARTGGVIAMVAMVVRRRLSSVLMAAVFTMRIALLPGQLVQLLFALASLDMPGTSIAMAMVSAANKRGRLIVHFRRKG